ncbi:MAG: tetratricopeptide repeat-containing protein [Proteobacteria bacterium]|nr:tetratricopeptide repeat-containing protein [Pseudomonadota bacterium]
MSSELIGTAAIVRAAYEQRDLSGLLGALQQRLMSDPNDLGAVLDLATLLEVCGQRQKSSELQQAALAGCRLFQTINGTGEGLRVLAIKTAGDLMANTPVEFLLEESDARLLSFYIDASQAAPPELPDHDVAILAVGESETNRPLLARIVDWQKGWPQPIVNGKPKQIVDLARERLWTAFRDSAQVVVPQTSVIGAQQLRAAATEICRLDELLSGCTLPLILRPFGAHAGHGTAKIDCVGEIAAYLDNVPGQHFMASPFINYASSDGYYRKQRIVFIDGEPFASHMAVSRNWMVHYLNADMEQHSSRRASEAEWMETFDTDFAARHALAFDDIVSRIGLDYFGIDCGELPDGRLIVFEADTAMIVHAMDPPDLFPYKKAAMTKLFRAFEAALLKRALHRVRASTIDYANPMASAV